MSYPAQGLDPTHEQILRHLRHSNLVAERAVTLGHHPFGAILVGPDQETVLLEQCNIDTVNHAESTLARIAATNFSAAFLWGCTLYTAVEPCCMCAGTAYWANIGRVVFGIDAERLRVFRGARGDQRDAELSCRDVFRASSHPIECIGPALVDEAAAAHDGAWKA